MHFQANSSLPFQKGVLITVGTSYGRGDPLSHAALPVEVLVSVREGPGAVPVVASWLLWLEAGKLIDFCHVCVGLGWLLTE